MKLGDTVRVGDNGGVGRSPATCKLIEICDEPDSGLVVVEETRDDAELRYLFSVPYAWWDALVLAEGVEKVAAPDCACILCGVEDSETANGSELCLDCARIEALVCRTRALRELVAWASLRTRSRTRKRGGGC